MPIGGFAGTSARTSDLHACMERLAYSVSAFTVTKRFPSGHIGVVNGGQFCTQEMVAVAFDGLIFDRDDLAGQLRHCPTESSSVVPSDAALVFAAYRKWGSDFSLHLDGEFAFAIWDEASKVFLLGTDVMGGRPLYYGRSGNSFCFASEPRGLLGWPGIDSRIDEETVARMLAVDPAPGRTLFRGIRKLPAGHLLRVGPGSREQIRKFWYPANGPELRLKDKREYAEAIRAALVRAVERRVPAAGLVGSHLSSGYDSSGVTALVAQALLRQNRPLLAYTAVPVHTVDATEISRNRFSNEWPLASNVAHMYPNIEHVPIPTNSANWWEPMDLLTDAFATPHGFLRNLRWYYGLSRHAQQRNVGTMFTGVAGNITTSYDGGMSLFHLRKTGRYQDLTRSLWERHRSGKRWKTLVNGTLLPSAQWTNRIKRAMGQKLPGLFDNSLMRPEFFASTGLDGSNASPMGQMIAGDRANGRTWRASLLARGDTGIAAAGEMRAFGLQRADPTADRRVVELCFSIPDDAFRPGEEPRELYREAIRNDLPAELLAERRRGLQGSDVLELFAESIDEFREEMERLETSPMANRVLDLPRMRSILESFSPAMLTAHRGAADRLYDYTFGGAILLGRFLRLHEEHTGYAA